MPTLMYTSALRRIRISAAPSSSSRRSRIPPTEEPAPAEFTITCGDGAIIIDGPYDPE